MELEVQTTLLQRALRHKTMEIGQAVEVGQRSKGGGCFYPISSAQPRPIDRILRNFVPKVAG